MSTQTAGYYHCVSRCVRRALLCGEDRTTGRSFTHRKQWIEDRLIAPAEIFAIGVYAYAVMSNHVHVVLRVDPVIAGDWSDHEMADRWLRLFPVRISERVDEAACRTKAALIAANAERVAVYRERLRSLSWFMRCLNEPIARRANHEDACTGRFWEGRFKCQVLLDETAVLACMAYVDLNPVRAGVAEDLSASEHTSVRRRLKSPQSEYGSLHPVAGSATDVLTLCNDEYLALVDWTGRRLHPKKQGRIAGDTPPIVRRLCPAPDDWISQVSSIETGYWRAIGNIPTLVAAARRIGQRWLKGVAVRRTPGPAVTA